MSSTLDYRNIGVISYASGAKFVIRPGEASQFSEFAEALRTANYSMDRFKNLGAALRKSREEEQLFDDYKSAVIVTIVAGKAEDDFAVPAILLKKKGVTIVGLALGSSYSTSQLRLLVSKPSDDHIIRSEFDDLKRLVSSTREKICIGG